MLSISFLSDTSMRYRFLVCIMIDRKGLSGYSGTEEGRTRLRRIQAAVHVQIDLSGSAGSEYPAGEASQSLCD